MRAVNGLQQSATTYICHRRPKVETRLTAAVQISGLNVCGDRNLTLAAFPIGCPLSSEPDLHWRSFR